MHDVLVVPLIGQDPGLIFSPGHVLALVDDSNKHLAWWSWSNYRGGTVVWIVGTAFVGSKRSPSGVIQYLDADGVLAIGTFSAVHCGIWGLKETVGTELKVTRGVERPDGDIGWWVVGIKLIVGHWIVTTSSIDLRGEVVLNFQGLRLLSVTIATPRGGASVLEIISAGICQLGACFKKRERDWVSQPCLQ